MSIALLCCSVLFVAGSLSTSPNRLPSILKLPRRGEFINESLTELPFSETYNTQESLKALCPSVRTLLKCAISSSLNVALDDTTCIGLSLNISHNLIIWFRDLLKASLVSNIVDQIYDEKVGFQVDSCFWKIAIETTDRNFYDCMTAILVSCIRERKEKILLASKLVSEIMDYNSRFAPWRSKSLSSMYRTLLNWSGLAFRTRRPNSLVGQRLKHVSKTRLTLGLRMMYDNAGVLDHLCLSDEESQVYEVFRNTGFSNFETPLNVNSLEQYLVWCIGRDDPIVETALISAATHLSGSYDFWYLLLKDVHILKGAGYLAHVFTIIRSRIPDNQIEMFLRIARKIDCRELHCIFSSGPFRAENRLLDVSDNVSKNLYFQPLCQFNNNGTRQAGNLAPSISPTGKTIRIFDSLNNTTIQIMINSFNQVFIERRGLRFVRVLFLDSVVQKWKRLPSKPLEIQPGWLMVICSHGSASALLKRLGNFTTANSLFRIKTLSGISIVPLIVMDHNNIEK